MYTTHLEDRVEFMKETQKVKTSNNLKMSRNQAKIEEILRNMEWTMKVKVVELKAMELETNEMRKIIASIQEVETKRDGLKIDLMDMKLFVMLTPWKKRN